MRLTLVHVSMKEEEVNVDYGRMVQPSQHHVAPYVKEIEWGLGWRGLRMFWVSIPVEVTKSFLWSGLIGHARSVRETSTASLSALEVKRVVLCVTPVCLK